mmetsp:Transcript_85150/g.275716  ORF Transcript_85150/g.275716 Transcript_85150/m.275716 type:complete len:197 (+) Transcript_85150:471-1061(+)
MPMVPLGPLFLALLNRFLLLLVFLVRRTCLAPLSGDVLDLHLLLGLFNESVLLIRVLAFHELRNTIKGLRLTRFLKYLRALAFGIGLDLANTCLYVLELDLMRVRRNDLNHFRTWTMLVVVSWTDGRPRRLLRSSCGGSSWPLGSDSTTSPWRSSSRTGACWATTWPLRRVSPRKWLLVDALAWLLTSILKQNRLT